MRFLRKSRHFFFVSILCLPQLLFAAAQKDRKTFLVSIPVVGSEGVFRGEYNINSRATVALDALSFGHRGGREELSKREIDKTKGDSLLTEGQEFGVMFGRYSNPDEMSGFNWGLGGGMRKMNGVWKKDAVTGSSSILDEKGKVHHYVDIQGPTVSGRLGYRYVGESAGFAIGGYLGIKHFQNKVTDKISATDSSYAPISQEDRIALQRRIQTTGTLLGVEVGWAF